MRRRSASLDRAQPPRGAWPARTSRAWRPSRRCLALLVLGAAVNPSFLTLDNLLNVLTRSAFVGGDRGRGHLRDRGRRARPVGRLHGGLRGRHHDPVHEYGRRRRRRRDPGARHGAGARRRGACGLANGLVTTLGRIEPFIVTLGTMGIFRGLTVWLAAGGSIAIKSQALRADYRPVYFGTVAASRCRCW